MFSFILLLKLLIIMWGQDGHPICTQCKRRISINNPTSTFSTHTTSIVKNKKLYTDIIHYFLRLKSFTFLYIQISDVFSLLKHNSKFIRFNGFQLLKLYIKSRRCKNYVCESTVISHVFGEFKLFLVYRVQDFFIFPSQFWLI